MQKEPRVGIAVIIKHEGKILLGKRKGSHGEGTWAFAGGHLEYGESWENCARREVDEEIGIEINNIHFLAATNTVFETGQHYITLFMMSDYVSGEVICKEPEKCEVWEWFAGTALPEPLFAPIYDLLEQDIEL